MDQKETILTIRKTIKLVYLSAFLKDEKPLSLMLVAPPEQSKTHFLLEHKTKFSHLATDLSYKGLIDLLLSNKNVKHIVIPDFLKVTEKNQSTKKSIITALNGYLEEGIFDINLANSQKIDLKGRSGGVITSTTKGSFFQNAKNWNALGFKSRFIIISWEYTPESLEKILDIISKEESTAKTKPKNLQYKLTKVKSSQKINRLLKPLAEGSPRRYKQLIVLLKCLALESGKEETDLDSVEELKEINQILNLRFSKI